MPQRKPERSIAQNRKARHDYFVDETFECGLALHGTEVKSLRAGKANLRESYASVTGGEMIVRGMHISPYEQGNRFNTDPLREKKLLMHKAEIRRLGGLVQRQGFALVPLEIVLRNGRMKLILGLCRGKKLYDKRDDLAKRDADRDIERAMRAQGKRSRDRDD
ncbi:MAG: SsrA-binding protein SmpB [Oscillospiraceae bacterium]|jgi:SsrA-binding protein|nr:SsrA-binding protein SmpB [Oscillospiraceae bacterium]